MKVILRCPLCREKFKYDTADGWPDECQICNQRIAHDRDDNDVVMPNFLSLKTQKTDKVARQIMDGSEVRAELAASMAGVPVSEMSDLKITDLNDRWDSEVAAKRVVNDVTRQMDAMRARGAPVGFQREQAMGQAAAAHTGQVPYAGAQMRTKLWNAHHAGSSGVAPEMVPLEIRNNPNYVRRG
jgi:hypothetical protein